MEEEKISKRVSAFEVWKVLRLFILVVGGMAVGSTVALFVITMSLIGGSLILAGVIGIGGYFASQQYKYMKYLETTYKVGGGASYGGGNN